VVEALSVIVQMAWRRWAGKRFLLCAPLHHHFQLLGWPENRIVVRFWIAAALCGIAGAGALKLNAHDVASRATRAEADPRRDGSLSYRAERARGAAEPTSNRIAGKP
jgi:hypothetical protein